MKKVENKNVHGPEYKTCVIRKRYEINDHFNSLFYFVNLEWYANDHNVKQ